MKLFSPKLYIEPYLLYELKSREQVHPQNWPARIFLNTYALIISIVQKMFIKNRLEIICKFNLFFTLCYHFIDLFTTKVLFLQHCLTLCQCTKI